MRLRPRALWALAIAAPSMVACGADEGEPTGTARSPVVVCPGGTVVPGTDVSQFQGTIDWTTVKGAGIAFAYARIADGLTADTTFSTNWAGIKAVGILRGGYQYFEPALDAAQQAALVVQKVGVLGGGDLPVMLDIETTGSQTAAQIVAALHTWVDAVTKGTGRTPFLYTGKAFWTTNVASSDFGSLPLWIANYGASCPDTPAPWTSWAFWQYSSTGSLNGISGPVDLDKFNGALADLQGYAAPPPVDAGTDAPSLDGSSGDGSIGTPDAAAADAAPKPAADAGGPPADAASSDAGGTVDDLVPQPGAGLWCAMGIPSRTSGPFSATLVALALIARRRRRSRERA